LAIRKKASPVAAEIAIHRRLLLMGRVSFETLNGQAHLPLWSAWPASGLYDTIKGDEFECNNFSHD
jgi:hypothetical protein